MKTTREIQPGESMPHDIKRKIYKCFFFVLFYIPLSVSAQQTEEGIFKLQVNEFMMGEISILSQDTSVWMNLPEFAERLGFGYTEVPDSLIFRSCMPSPTNPFFIRGDTLYMPDRQINIKEKLLRDAEGTPFLAPGAMEEITGYSLEVNYRSLIIICTTQIPPPSILRYQQKQKRELSLTIAPKNVQVDTAPLPSFHLSSIGYQIAYGLTVGKKYDNISIGLNTNGTLFNGCFQTNLITTPGSKNHSPYFTVNWEKRETKFRWFKYVNLFRGNTTLAMNTNGYANGIHASNQSWKDSRERTFVYRGTFKPDADLEIYHNGKFVTLVHSDSTGAYQADIQVNDGDNNITTTFYNAFALPESTRRTIRLAPDMQPDKVLSHASSAGYIDDGSLFFKTRWSYGLSHFTTLRASNETLFGRHMFKTLFTLEGSYLHDKIFLLNMRYSPGTRWSISANINYPEQVSTSFFFERYNRKQNKILFVPQQRFDFRLNLEKAWFNVNSLFQVNMQHLRYYYSEIFSFNLRQTFYYRGFITSFAANSYSQQAGKFDRWTYNLKGCYSRNRWSNELEFEHRSFYNQNKLQYRSNYFPKQNLSYQFNLEYELSRKQYSVSIGISWLLSPIRLSSISYFSAYNTTQSIQAIGSVQFYDRQTWLLTANNNGASLHVVVFLDTNGNNRFDEGEVIIPEANVIMHATSEIIRNQQGIFFPNLPAESVLSFVIPRQTFQDITWQIKPEEKAILLAPFQKETIHVPIHIVSEISGQITQGNEGIPNVQIRITNLESGDYITLTSDEWGFFSYDKITPGNYSVELSRDYLEANDLIRTDERAIRINIPSSNEGVVIEGIRFNLKQNTLK